MNFERYAGLASAVGVVLILTMVGWLGVAGPVWRAYWTASPDQWLGFAGAVLTACATIGGIIAAWFAIKRQVRISILTREEERIERALPGLSDANMFLGLLSMQLHGMLIGSHALSVLEANGFDGNSKTSFVSEVKDHIPSADDADQRRLAGILRLIWVASVELASSDQTLNYATKIAASELVNDIGRSQAGDTIKEQRERQMLHYRSLRDAGDLLQTFVADTMNRMQRLERRREACRKEIDRFFGDE